MVTATSLVRTPTLPGSSSGLLTAALESDEAPVQVFSGHELTARMTVDAPADQKGVTVAWGLLNAEDVDAFREDPDQAIDFRFEIIGEQVVDVKKGVNTITTPIALPPGITGDWYLGPAVDLLGVVQGEPTKYDNTPPFAEWDLVSISGDQEGKPDIAIESAEWDGELFLYELPDIDELEPIEFVDPETGETLAFFDNYEPDITALVSMSVTGAEPVDDIPLCAELYIVDIDDIEQDEEDVDVFEGPINLLVFHPFEPRRSDFGAGELLLDPLTGEEIPGNWEREVEVGLDPGEPNFGELSLLIPPDGRALVQEYLSLGHPPEGFVVNFVAGQPSDDFEEFEGANFLEDDFEDFEDFEGYEEEERGDVDSNNELWGLLTILTVEDEFFFDDDDFGDGFGDFDDVFDDDFGEGFGDGSGDGDFGDVFGEDFGEGCSPVVKNKDFDAEFNPAGGLVAIGLDANANAKLDGQGASASSRASIPLTLLGTKANIVGFAANGKVRPSSGPGDSGSSSFLLEFKLLDQVVACIPGGVSVLSDCEPAVSDGDNPFSDEFTQPIVDKSVEGRTTVFGGLVAVDGSATASFGFREAVTLTGAELQLQAGPYGRINGRANLGVSAGQFAKIGLTVADPKSTADGVFTLFDERFSAQATATLDPVVDGKLAGTLAFGLVNQLQGPSGSAVIELEYVNSVEGGFKALVATGCDLAGNVASGAQKVGNFISGVGESFIDLFLPSKAASCVDVPREKKRIQLFSFDVGDLAPLVIPLAETSGSVCLE